MSNAYDKAKHLNSLTIDIARDQYARLYLADGSYDLPNCIIMVGRRGTRYTSSDRAEVARMFMRYVRLLRRGTADRLLDALDKRDNARAKIAAIRDQVQSEMAGDGFFAMVMDPDLYDRIDAETARRVDSQPGILRSLERAGRQIAETLASV